jgi:hypothetical protein
VTEESGSTQPKALRINLDARKFGTFAEIGAGQEVVRWFFHAGKAASTIAKTISAYDMAISDGLYGSARRYVSRQRLEAMLDHEFSSLVEAWIRPAASTQRSSYSPIRPLPRRIPNGPGGIPGPECASRGSRAANAPRSFFTAKCWMP